MGCCQSNLETGELALYSVDHLNSQNLRLVQTEEDFGDISLSSHDHSDYKPSLETSNTFIGDSSTICSRGKSVSLHRANFESAFLQSSGLYRSPLTKREGCSSYKIT